MRKATSDEVRGMIEFLADNIDACPLFPEELESIFDGFREALLWAECVDTPEGDMSLGMLEDYHVSDKGEESIRKAFDARIGDFPVDLIRAYQKHRPLSHFGHDLYLTCAGHGAGFWDRGLDELGDVLSDICKTCRLEVYGYLESEDSDTVEVDCM